MSLGRLDTIFFLILAMVVAGTIGAIAFALIGAGMPAISPQPPSAPATRPLSR